MEHKQEIKKLFEPGQPGHGKTFLDDDWFRYKPDGTFEVHELCTGCEPNGSCPFHPPGCKCSDGECQNRIYHLTGDFRSENVFLDEDRLEINESLKVRDHSSTGFSWGYDGSGPAQLALAILLKIFSREIDRLAEILSTRKGFLALAHYQDFKWALITGLSRENFDVRFRIKIGAEGIRVEKVPDQSEGMKKGIVIDEVDRQEYRERFGKEPENL